MYVQQRWHRLSDNNAEFLIDSNGTTSESGDAILDLGDRLTGIFTIKTFESLSGGGALRKGYRRRHYPFWFMQQCGLCRE